MKSRLKRAARDVVSSRRGSGLGKGCDWAPDRCTRRLIKGPPPLVAYVKYILALSKKGLSLGSSYVEVLLHPSSVTALTFCTISDWTLARTCPELTPYGSLLQISLLHTDA